MRESEGAMVVDREQLQANISRVRERIAEAAGRAGRDPDEITLVAVSKTHPPEYVAVAYELGICDFGENRVEEGNPKMVAVDALLPPDAAPVRWHMIGHVQSRKAQDVIDGRYVLVHSVDRVKLARRLSRLALEAGRRQDILLEVNVSGEPTKFGFDPESITPAVEEIATLPGVRVRGLMTMAPIVEDPEQARPVFEALRVLRDALAAQFPELDWHHLSMGMTDDFEVAIEEGATIVRIGRAIFGPRHE
ncbi:MAG: YggS family pyridoxal phosphate-dependent enzyme [Anaerolineae bacterium]